MNLFRLLLPPTPKTSTAPDAKTLETLRAAVRMQPNVPPPVRVRHRLMAAVRVAPRPLPQWLGDVWAVTVALACFLILWGVFQPGIVLGWQATPQPGAIFRIYRAESAQATYTLLAEIPADDSSTYRYVDSVLLPGATYHYRVEVVGAAGVLAHSTSIRATAWQAVPGLLAVLLCSLMFGWLAGLWFNRSLMVYPPTHSPA